MRIFSTLFRPTPDVKQWPGIATTLIKGLQDVRRQWFEQCVFAMELGIQADFNEKARVVQTQLAGSVAHAIAGYQFSYLSQDLEKNSYLPKGSIKEFMNLLFGRVAGSEINDLLKYHNRFEQVSNDTSTQYFRLAVEVARYVINQEPSMLISLHVSSIATALSDETSIVIAEAFGDMLRVEKLRRKNKKLN